MLVRVIPMSSGRLAHHQRAALDIADFSGPGSSHLHCGRRRRRPDSTRECGKPIAIRERADVILWPRALLQLSFVDRPELSNSGPVLLFHVLVVLLEQLLLLGNPWGGKVVPGCRPLPENIVAQFDFAAPEEILERRGHGLRRDHWISVYYR